MITRAEIEAAASEYFHAFEIVGTTKDFITGAQWALDTILERSAEGFSEWKEIQIQSIVGLEEKEAVAKLRQALTPDGTWSAATLAAEKRGAERIEGLELRIGGLRESLNYLIDTMAPGNYPFAAEHAAKQAMSALAKDDELAKESK